MFTGLVEAIGRLASHAPGRVVVDTPELSPHLALGDSVAVNGICLTVAQRQGPRVSFDYAEATREHTSITHWKVGRRLNLERALAVGGRLGGHLVQGHVDGLAHVLGIQKGDGVRFSVALPEALARYVVAQGSITLDGVSLTAAELDGLRVTAVLVPHTWAHVALADLKVGDAVNVEVDVLAKYVERLLGPLAPASSLAKGSGVSLERLAEWGYA